MLEEQAPFLLTVAISGFILTFLGALIETRKALESFLLACITPVLAVALAYPLYEHGNSDDDDAEITAEMNAFVYGAVSEADSLNLDLRPEFQAYAQPSSDEAQIEAAKSIQEMQSKNRLMPYSQTLLLKMWLQKCFGHSDFLGYAYPLDELSVKPIVRHYQTSYEGSDSACLINNPA